MQKQWTITVDLTTNITKSIKHKNLNNCKAQKKSVGISLRLQRKFLVKVLLCPQLCCEHSRGTAMHLCNPAVKYLLRFS